MPTLDNARTAVRFTKAYKVPLISGITLVGGVIGTFTLASHVNDKNDVQLTSAPAAVELIDVAPTSPKQSPAAQVIETTPAIIPQTPPTIETKPLDQSQFAYCQAVSLSAANGAMNRFGETDYAEALRFQFSAHNVLLEPSPDGKNFRVVIRQHDNGNNKPDDCGNVRTPDGGASLQRTAFNPDLARTLG